MIARFITTTVLLGAAVGCLLAGLNLLGVFAVPWALVGLAFAPLLGVLAFIGLVAAILVATSNHNPW